MKLKSNLLQKNYQPIFTVYLMHTKNLNLY